LHGQVLGGEKRGAGIWAGKRKRNLHAWESVEIITGMRSMPSMRKKMGWLIRRKKVRLRKRKSKQKEKGLRDRPKRAKRGVSNLRS